MFQWIGILAALVFAVALRYEAPSEAGMQMNASVESPLSQGMRGYWKLDDGSGTSATDSSGNSNTLSMTGSPSWTTGNIGPYALDFSGSGQYLFVASPSSALDFADGASFTITGWFNRDTFANDHTILSTKSGQSTESDGYIAYIDDATDQLIIRFDENGTTDARTFTSTSTFTATGWHHFALSWNESAPDAILYIDGKPDGSGSGTAFASMGNLANTNAFYIGAETDAGNPFDGKLDDIRIYGYALSADQVKKIYNTTSPTQPVDTSLVGHWTFDGTDIQGTTAIDRSGKGNNGTITGAVPTLGKLGQALSFNGTSDYVTTTNIPEVNSATYFTLSLWLKQDITGSRGETVVGKYDSCCSGHFDFQTGHGAVGDNAMYFRFYYLNGAYTADGTHTLGTWEYWTVVFDGTQSGNANRLKIYKDGTSLSLSFEGTIETTTPADNSLPVRIAQRGDLDGTPFNGFLDDIRIYNRALSATEVADLYNMGK